MKLQKPQFQLARVFDDGSQETAEIMPQQKLVPVLLTTASVGVMIWTIPCGSLHAYVASVDWEAINRDQISQVVTTRRSWGCASSGLL